ncbi:MAG: PA domain-containing protein [Myxococcaceae bacterium]
MNGYRLATLLTVGLGWAAASASAADLSIQNPHAAGFTDQTPAAPLSVNVGTTRGDQALIVFQTTAAMWGASVRSNVPIVINSEFTSASTDSIFTCTANSTVLAYTTPGGYVSSQNFPNPAAGYDFSLANALSGTDLSNNGAQFQVNINADLGTSNCVFPGAWYFGLDSNIPENQISLFTTLLHEFGHGLGYSSLVDPSSGVDEANSFAIFDFHIFDVDAGVPWTSEDKNQRLALASTPSSIGFDGDAVRADIPTYLAAPPTLLTTFNTATTSLAFAKGDFSGPLVGAGPLAAATPLDGCSDLSNATDIAGKFALIERSFADAGVVCTFISKAERAADAGAIGVVVFDYQDEGLVEMAGSPTLSIPAVFIGHQDGTSLANELTQGPVDVSFGTSGHISNTDSSQTRVLLYTPSTVSSGSSVIHWNANSYPHTLNLEFAIQPDIRLNMDFTPDVMADLGWSVVQGLAVSVVKLLDPEVPAGAQFSYVTAIINRRPTTIDNVTLDLALPSGTTFISNVSSVWPSSPGGCTTAFPCALGALQPGQVVLVVTTVQAAATATSPFVTTATLTPSSNGGTCVESEYNTAPIPCDSLTATSSQTVATGGDLQVSVVGPSSLVPGSTATVTTTITNAGPGDAAGVVLNGTVSGPAAAPPVFSSNSGYCSTGFPCNLYTLPSGTSATVTTVFNVPAGFENGATFTATASETTPDANPANNTASFVFSTTSTSGGKGGCSTTAEPVTLLGLLAAAGTMVLRRRRDTF